MVESKTRKSVFLREVVRHLGLTQCQVETVRFEQLLARPAYLETMHVLSIRAVRVEVQELRTFQAFLAPGGRMLWFLGGSQVMPLVAPPLTLVSEYPLVEALRSRLVVLRQQAIGG
jgi:16S rRNA G527 N7-methylase RsmG